MKSFSLVRFEEIMRELGKNYGVLGRTALHSVSCEFLKTSGDRPWNENLSLSAHMIT